MTGLRPSELLSLALALLLGACGPRSDPGPQGGDSSADDTGEAAPPPCWERATDLEEHELLFSCYGVLDTVAGKGEIPDKGVSGWDEAYEAGSALEAELSRPHMTMSDAAGRLFIADKDAHAVRRVDPDGTIHTVAGTSRPGDDGDGPADGTTLRLSSPNGLWAQADGTVFIHDMGNDKVRVLSPEGTLETLFETGGSGTGRGLWASDDGSHVVFSAGARLKQWTPDAGVSTLASGFSSLGMVVPHPEGGFAVADRGGHGVYRVDEDGSTELIAGNEGTSGGGDGEPALETGLHEVRAIWFHPLGGFLVATHQGGQVWYVDTEGLIHLMVDGDSEHSHAGDGEAFDTEGAKISEPRAVTLDPVGRILITENDHGYVRRIELAD